MSSSDDEEILSEQQFIDKKKLSYKYIVINTINDSYEIYKSTRNIEKMIKELHPEETFSHSTIARRFNESPNKYFQFKELLIKELTW